MVIYFYNMFPEDTGMMIVTYPDNTVSWLSYGDWHSTDSEDSYAYFNEQLPVSAKMLNIIEWLE